MNKIRKKESQRKPLSKKKKRLIVMIAAATLLVLAACYTVFVAPLLEKEQWIYKEETVERGTLKVGITESGSLEYGITSILYDLDLDVSTEEEDDEDSEETVQKYLKIEEVLVKSGQRISEGDLLYRFTQDSVEDVRLLLESALADVQSDYNEAQAEYNLAALEAQADYEIRKQEEQYASAIYRNAKAAVDNQITATQLEINQRNANIASLQEQLTEAQEDYNEVWEQFQTAQKPSAQEYSTENFMAMQKAYLNLQTQYENAGSALDRAQQALEENASEIEALTKELASLKARKTIDQLDVEEEYQESIIRGENAALTYAAQMESLAETLREAQQEKEQKQEQLEAFEAFVGEDGCLYADGSGIVTQVSYEAGDRLKEAGIMVSYAKPEEMTIAVDVTQEDIVDLQVGDQVDITFTAYEDTSYTGRIRSVNTTATATGSNTVSYTVVIAVEGDTTLLYGGMTADIVFVTEQKDDVLFISRKAIVEESGKTYVYVRNRMGAMELKEVETGIHNGVDIEILSGLEEGETIYLASRVSSEEAVMNSSQETMPDAGGTGFGNGEFTMPEGITGSFPEGGMPDMGSGMPDMGGRPGMDGGMPNMGGDMP